MPLKPTRQIYSMSELKKNCRPTRNKEQIVMGRPSGSVLKKMQSMVMEVRRDSRRVVMPCLLEI